MDTKKLGQEAAYPEVVIMPATSSVEAGVRAIRSGLTKREAFAMAAMQGLLASQEINPRVPVQAVAFADDLLRELAKEA